MLDQLWTTALQNLQNNQFLAGGFVLGALAAIVHQCKEIPRRIWDWTKSRFIIQIEIRDRDEAFQWINKWLALHPYGAKRARLLTVKTERADASNRPQACGEYDGQPRIILSPATGHHWFFYKGRLVMLEREKKDQGATPSGGLSSMGEEKESFVIQMFGRSRKHIVELLEEARELVHPKGEKRISILTARYDDWHVSAKRRPRSLESVVLRAGVMEEIIEAIKLFRSREQWYIQRGIPHRLGFLTEGPPGSGKSSLVIGVASYFNYDIAIVNVNSAGMSDDVLCRLLADVPKDTIVLVEDIDCVFNERVATDDNASSVTFSGLLNAIDGVASGEGRIMFMTTNHPEKLDEALIRPGRADHRIHVGTPDAGQASRMFERFYPDATSRQNLRFVEALSLDNTSMAAIQVHLTKYSEDPETAIKHAGETTKQAKASPSDHAATSKVTRPA